MRIILLLNIYFIFIPGVPTPPTNLCVETNTASLEQSTPFLYKLKGNQDDKE